MQLDQPIISRWISISQQTVFQLMSHCGSTSLKNSMKRCSWDGPQVASWRILNLLKMIQVKTLLLIAHLIAQEDFELL